jgi:hypothetical protein
MMKSTLNNGIVDGDEDDEVGPEISDGEDVVSAGAAGATGATGTIGTILIILSTLLPIPPAFKEKRETKHSGTTQSIKR